MEPFLRIRNSEVASPKTRYKNWYNNMV